MNESSSGVAVPRTGIEPARLAAHAPETCASTYSATWAIGFTECKDKGFFVKNKQKRLKKHLFIQKLILEEQQINYGYRYISVGQIEDRPEKIIVAVDQKTQE